MSQYCSQLCFLKNSRAKVVVGHILKMMLPKMRLLMVPSHTSEHWFFSLGVPSESALKQQQKQQQNIQFIWFDLIFLR